MNKNRPRHADTDTAAAQTLLIGMYVGLEKQPEQNKTATTGRNCLRTRRKTYRATRYTC